MFFSIILSVTVISIPSVFGTMNKPTGCFFGPHLFKNWRCLSQHMCQQKMLPERFDYGHLEGPHSHVKKKNMKFNLVAIRCDCSEY